MASSVADAPHPKLQTAVYMTMGHEDGVMLGGAQLTYESRQVK